MKKNKLLSLVLVLGAVVVICFAGRSKGNNGGGTSAGNPDWRTTTLHEVWAYASLPTVITACGNTFPQSSGSNTCPNILPSTPTSNNYYALITVESLESNSPSDRKTFCRSIQSQTPIQIPYNHRYRVTVDFIEKCSGCMQGNLGVPFGGSRRIAWMVRQEFNRFALYPSVNFYYNGLRNC